MHPIIHHVVVSADGFIAGRGADVSAFPHSGPIADDYLTRLSGYAVAIMGRATYDFGLAHGLPPGANPYPRCGPQRGARSTCAAAGNLRGPSPTPGTSAPCA
ncbi:hypothetical protein [Gymnodinialimonas ulvae]|uniref:hypothetical protein n=1 Tax=Gymnodinialimonas ulvae TaxID=3126504 RepID=UPI0030AFC913